MKLRQNHSIETAAAKAGMSRATGYRIASAPRFTIKRVRSGVETLLSRRKVSKDIRGRLQSHGVAGVQDRHYDGHDYLTEKRQALTALYAALEPKRDKVTPIRSAAA